MKLGHVSNRFNEKFAELKLRYSAFFEYQQQKFAQVPN